MDHHHEDDPKSNDTMTTTSELISNAQLLLDTSIEDLKTDKNVLVSTMESVTRLTREVEYEEKAAENAKAEADRSSLDVLAMADERKQALRQVEEIHDALVRKVYVQKAVLATKQTVLQYRVDKLLDNRERSLQVLHEISRSLEMRLSSALTKKDLAIKKKQNNEALSQLIAAYEDFRIQKMIEESNIRKQESLEILKFLEFFIDRAHVVDMLEDEISNENLTMSPVSNSSLRSDKPEGKQTYEKVANGFADITESGKQNGKPQGNQVFDENIKNAKINNKRHGNQKFATRIKKVKIKRFHVVLKRCEAANHKADGFDDIQE